MIRTKKYHQTNENIVDEAMLIKKAQKSPRDFAPLYSQYYLQIFRYVIKRVKDESDASEITSDIFAKAMFNIKKYKFKGLPFSSWLFRIASNQVTDFYRKNKSTKTVKVTEEQLNYLADASEDDISNKSDSESRVSDLLQSLGSLSENDLELIELRFFEKRSFKEIAEILDLTEVNARTKTHRVIGKLKAKIN